MHKSLNAKAFPHFMERAWKSYRSTKPVGRIYTRVSVEEFSPAYNMPFDERILKRFQLSTEEIDKASEVKAKYDIAMRRLMGQHERLISEFEIWSTFILSRPRVGNDYKLAETVGREVSALKNRFRVACGEAMTGSAQKLDVFSYSGIDLEKLDRFVAAMYTVTHNEVQRALREQSMPMIDEEGTKTSENQGFGLQMPLISFPWLFHKELARVASGGKPVARKDFGTVDGNAGRASQPQSAVGNTQTMEKTLNQSPVEIQTRDKTEREFGDEEQQKVLVKKGETSTDETGGKDGVLTASGKVIKHGEILTLFDGIGDATSTERASSASEPNYGEASQSVEPENCSSYRNTSIDGEDVDEDEYNDPLEELAKIIAGR